MTIHLMVGFMGFGKTHVAKQLEQENSAVRLTHDEFMLARFGNNPDDFQTKYQIVDDFIRTETKKYVQEGKDVILDYGFWTREKREEYYHWAKELTEDVIFHVVYCDLSEAKKRVLQRTKTDKNVLYIDENIFDTLYNQYEPWSNEDKYPVVFHYSADEKIYTSSYSSLVTKTHFGVYGVIIRNNQILLIKKARGPYKGLYDLPGGSQERGESYIETLTREIDEETGCKVVKVGNKRFNSVIFSDFTIASGENGVLQHNAVLYDAEIEGKACTQGDGLDSNGAIWVDIESLTTENATPYALIGGGKSYSKSELIK